jgi:hypothetical protein
MLGQWVCNRAVEGIVREESMFLASLVMVYEAWSIYTGEWLGVLLMSWL